MSEPLDPHRLRTFRVVAEAGSITRAAEQLHLSQPAVTAQVQQLEGQCGCALLVRRARGVTLTAAGRTLLDYAQRLDALLAEATASVGRPRAPLGPLVIAASTTIASYLLPSLVAAFRKSAGPIAVRVEVGNTEQVLAWIEEGTVPLGLVEGPPRAARVRLVPFLKDEIVAVAAADAPRAWVRARRAGDLAHVPIVWREPGSGTRAVVSRALRRAAGRRAPHDADLQMGSTEAIKEAVALGLGVGFLSRWSVRAELAAGKLRVLPLADLAIERTFSWAIPGRDLAGQAARFHRFAVGAPPSVG